MMSNFSERQVRFQGYYRVLKKFTSKKNQVYLIRQIFYPAKVTSEDLLVLKRFANNYDKEAYWLSFLRKNKLNVPEIISQGKGYLILSYLQGETLCDFFDNQEGLGVDIQELAPVLNQFSLWLKKFYQIAQTQGQRIIGDVNLRNFIYNPQNGEIYGIDFEECIPGEIEVDIGKICAFVLTYTPTYTPWKCLLVKELLANLTQRLSLNRKKVEVEFQQELERIHQRRNLLFPDGSNWRDYI